MNSKNSLDPKPPLRWQGIIFALAATLLLVTVGTYIAPVGAGQTSLLITLAMAVLAGVLSALYIGQRGGVHALIGGLLAALILGVFVLQGVWQLAIFAWLGCILGAAATEVVRRRRKK